MAAAYVSLALKTQGYKSLSLEKWSKKWNEERAVEPEPRFQTVLIVKEEHEGVFVLWRVQFPFLTCDSTDVCNQLLDLYDEIQRQTAESAQSSLTETTAPVQRIDGGSGTGPLTHLEKVYLGCSDVSLYCTDNAEHQRPCDSFDVWKFTADSWSFDYSKSESLGSSSAVLDYILFTPNIEVVWL